jgi:hypothetical protein
MKAKATERERKQPKLTELDKQKQLLQKITEEKAQLEVLAVDPKRAAQKEQRTGSGF